MTRPRKEIVCIDNTPYYHITSRCVRRTFLCGIDQQTGRNFEHRRQWIVDRLRLLASLFTIDICSYAVMSNHYHITLKLTPEDAKTWSNDEVIKRWLCLYKGPLLVQRYQNNEVLTSAETITLNEIVNIWRKRLTRLDWFMKCLNEPIARSANKEDQCTGHFWEARYTSQALPTEQAVLSCMAYVDLNPIRAKMADRPETSDYTSIQERIVPRFDLKKAVQKQMTQKALLYFNFPVKPLLPLSGIVLSNSKAGLAFSFSNYLELLDWTGRVIRNNKHGFIPPNLSPILERLSITPQKWLINSQSFKPAYSRDFLKCKRNTVAI